MDGPSTILTWFDTNVDVLSGMAAFLAILGVGGAITRYLWMRTTDHGWPEFLSDWRNVALISAGSLAAGLLAVIVLSSAPPAIGPGPKGGKSSLVILPFNNLLGDPEQENLADGMTEDVTTLLSRNPYFNVIARNSAFAYKGKSPDVRDVGHELGVRYVVEGSLRRVSDQMRVTVQLIDSATGAHLWAEQYDRPLDKIFDVQDEITSGIVVALGDAVFTAELTRGKDISPAQLDATTAFAKSSEIFAAWGTKNMSESLHLLRQAIELDPNHALAHAALAGRLLRQANDLYSDTPEEDLQKAKSFAEKALGLSKNDPAVLLSVGEYYYQTGRRDEAKAVFEKVLELYPDQTDAVAGMGLIFIYVGRADEALPLIERAIRLSPKSSWRPFYENWLCIALYRLGRYPEAEAACRRSIASTLVGWPAWMNLAIAQAAHSDVEGARASVAKARSIQPKLTLDLYRQRLIRMRGDSGTREVALVEKIWASENLAQGTN